MACMHKNYIWEDNFHVVHRREHLHHSARLSNIWLSWVMKGVLVSTIYDYHQIVFPNVLNVHGDQQESQQTSMSKIYVKVKTVGMSNLTNCWGLVCYAFCSSYAMCGKYSFGITGYLNTRGDYHFKLQEFRVKMAKKETYLGIFE